MVNKRGLSPDEYFNLDPEVLDMLMVYDAYIEPTGTQIEMLKHAYQCYYTTISNGNLTPEARRSIKVADFDFLDVLNSDLTTQEKAEVKEQKKKEAQANDIKSIGDAIRNQVLGKKNGK
ncbi:hypothetical protein ACY2UH_004407 [Escherichia coli]|uniref:hypothetical protein n=2 Tax=Escherichia coli TaxID=562 RepID=UPI00085487D1|nr:hypothetical protein [Escherichia coli]MCH4653151.1 hypothetical protein [Escherichia coli]MCW9966479.1 hypothetical protein [Escherichia coli]MDA6219708.1 hypothetical protein [Escherichia coli]MDI1059027.1 hypothetical protein [Escherichia coli]OEN27308.1 hypothetical protein BHF44_26390 [Escherichia coli]